MERTFRQKLNRGYSEGLSNALEIALVPVVFGGIGWLLDRTFGTEPYFLIGLVVFAFVGMILKLWLRYDRAMEQEESDRIWNRGSRVAPPAGGGVE